MRPVLTPAEMAAVDDAAPEPVETLIDRAGRAVARVALDMLGGGYGRVVRVIAGPGNNGADGRVAADVLRRRGVQVEVIEADACPTRLSAADLIIDAAFGTGFRGAWRAPDVGSSPVLAVDVPSGVDALTGSTSGDVLRADRTVTFQALKPGLLFGDGARRAGQVEVVDIGLDVSVPGPTHCHLVGASDAGEWWPSRSVGAHKWNGAVRVVAGSAGMTGAAVLCSSAAGRAGAGLVKLSSIDATADARPEVIQDSLHGDAWDRVVADDIERFGALAIGPGLGRAAETVSCALRCIADVPVPVVVDGDGLGALANSPGGAAAVISRRNEATVLSPHDGEFEQLTGSPPGDDRIAATRALAAELGCVVLLKGATTVVADAGGDVLLVDHGDQRLATAGSGDVLTGIIATALAAGADPLRAAAAAAWLHAEAAHLCEPAGLLAGDLIEALPRAIAGVI